MRNSVLEELRVRRLSDIQEEMSCRAVWRWEILESKLRGWKEKKVEYHLHRETEEIRVLSGVVYMTKNRGPRTEPGGTPQEQGRRRLLGSGPAM